MYKKILSESEVIIYRLSDRANIPMSEDNTDYQRFLEWLKEENKTLDDLEEAFPETPEQRQKKYSYAIQHHIDMKAREKDYDSSLSVVSYRESKNFQWKKEAEDFSSWRDNVWIYAVKILEEVSSGAMEAPSIKEFVSNSPELIW